MGVLDEMRGIFWKREVEEGYRREWGLEKSGEERRDWMWKTETMRIRWELKSYKEHIFHNHKSKSKSMVERSKRKKRSQVQ